MTESRHTSPSPRPQLHPDLSTNHRILVVDDNEAIHGDFRKILGTAADHGDFDAAEAAMFGSSSGGRPRTRFAMEFACQGAQALQIVKDAAAVGKRFSLVFMDVRMPPGWDGLETTRRLWDVDPDLQVVICTAFSDKSWEEMMDHLCHPERVLILKKPFDAIEVLQLAHALTEKWSLLQAARTNLCELETQVAARTAEVREQAMLLEKARDAIMVWDLDDTVQFWNQGAENLYGLTAAEAMGRRIGDIFDAGKKGDALRKAEKAVSEKGIWHGELQADEDVTIDCSWTLVLDEQERPKSILAIHTDITARKTLEAKNLRSQRLESIGTLAGGIAHDLNNILQPITLAMDLIRARLPDPSTRDMLDLVIENSGRATSLVQQVLSFARGVQGERVSIQPNDLVQEIARMVRETFPKNIELRLHAPENPWPLSGDSTQLHQVLLNLCLNARDAMPDGGILTIGIENAETDGRHVVLSVADNGTGIPPELHEKIFDPFFTTKKQGEGTGLGLATTLGIVRSHGGFITMKSPEGGGTTFRVSIPVEKIESSPVPVPTARTEMPIPQGDGELILVVDDEEPVLNVIRQTLEEFGYRVLTASDGAEGCMIFAQHSDEIDVIITDMVMPVADGPEMIAALTSFRPDIRIIAISGMATEASIGEMDRLGVRRIIPKPFTTPAILWALREVLDGKPATPPASYPYQSCLAC